MIIAPTRDRNVWTICSANVMAIVIIRPYEGSQHELLHADVGGRSGAGRSALRVGDWLAIRAGGIWLILSGSGVRGGEGVRSGQLAGGRYGCKPCEFRPCGDVPLGLAVAVLAAGPGSALAAGNSGPSGLTLQVTAPPPPAQDVYISDQGNNRVVKVAPSGTQTTVGSGFDSPAQVAADAAGDVYVADMENNRVEKVTPAGVQTTVISGLDAPAGVAVDSEGDVYVSNTGTAPSWKSARVGR